MSADLHNPVVRLARARARAEQEAPGNPYHRARLVALAAADYHEAIARWMHAHGHHAAARAVESRATIARRRAAEDAALE